MAPTEAGKAVLDSLLGREVSERDHTPTFQSAQVFLTHPEICTREWIISDVRRVTGTPGRRSSLNLRKRFTESSVVLRMAPIAANCVALPTPQSVAVSRTLRRTALGPHGWGVNHGA